MRDKVRRGAVAAKGALAAAVLGSALASAVLGTAQAAGARGTRAADERPCGVTDVPTVAVTGAPVVPSPLTAIATACQPTLDWVDPYGGALLQAWRPLHYSTPGAPPAIAGPDGTLLVVMPGTTVQSQPTLEEVSPDGTVLWQLSLPGMPTATAGDAQVLAFSFGEDATIVDVATHTETPIPAPNRANPYVVTVGVAGPIAIVETTDSNNRSDMQTLGPGTVALYSPDGSKVDSFTLADHPSPTMPDSIEQISIASGASEAYLLFNDLVRTAGVYAISAQGKVSGPYPVPIRDAGYVYSLPGDRLLFTDTSDELAAIGPSGLTTLWQRTLPGKVLPFEGAVVGGGDLVTSTIDGPSPHPLAVVDLKTGAVVRTLGTPNTSATALAAGSYGVLAETQPAPPPSGAPETTHDALVLFSPTGRIVWRQPVVPMFGETLFPDVLPLGGGEAMLFPELPGYAVLWGGRAATSVTAADLASLVPVTDQPSLKLPARTDVAGYEVFEGPTAVDRAHPLTVPAAIAHTLMRFVVAAVNAQGRPVVSPGSVPVRISVTGGPGGRTKVLWNLGIAVGAGTTGTPFTYATGAAGTFSFAVSVEYRYLSTFDPEAPRAIVAGERFRVEVGLVDPNGIAVPLPPGDRVEVFAAPTSRFRARAAVAVPDGHGLYVATFDALRRTGAVRFEAEVLEGGKVVANSGTTSAAIVDVPAPTLSVTSGRGGERVRVAAAAGTTPVAYVLYRQAGTATALASDTAPLAVLAPESWPSAVATYLDAAHHGPVTYFARALYNLGFMGPPASVAADGRA